MAWLCLNKHNRPISQILQCVCSISPNTPFRSEMCTFLLGTRTPRMPAPAFWDTPRCPMITHTGDSHKIPSQNKTKSKLQIFKKLPKFQILKFCKKLNMRHTFWSCLIRWMDRRTDGRTEWNQYTPNNFVVMPCGIWNRCIWGFATFIHLVIIYQWVWVKEM